MSHYIGCDAHKQYSVFVVTDDRGQQGRPVRVEHDGDTFERYLAELPAGSPIAVETTGQWYWLVDAMERAGHQPKLTHAGKAKLMMGQVNKTDKLDAQGLARLLRSGTLPTVWIPPGELRDQREVPRLRMALVRMRTALKNRIHASLAEYGLHNGEVSDLFGRAGREWLVKALIQLPPETARAVQRQLELLDQVEQHIGEVEERIDQVVEHTPAMQRLKTLPGVGNILATVLALEIGSVDRFPGAGHLASYAGTVPRIHASGGRSFRGRVRPDVNRYLKWALVEAANVVVLQRARFPERHVSHLYQRIQSRSGHAKAVVAVARHLAEAAFWVLKKDEPYREPASQSRPAPSQPRSTRASHERKTLVH